MLFFFFAPPRTKFKILKQAKPGIPNKISSYYKNFFLAYNFRVLSQPLPGIRTHIS